MIEDSKTNLLPLVSIVMPIRNEQEFISDCLSAVLNQDYPKDKIEIIIVDGLSDDGTMDVLNNFSNEYNRIKIYTNHNKIVSTALNIGIKSSNGEIIIRIDGHTIIDSNFVSQNIKLLKTHPNAWIVGGPIIHRGRNYFSKATAYTMSSYIGVGNASHRKSNYEGYAEGAVFPAIRRFVFDKVGYFDEHFVRNQDDEFNFRVKKSGGNIYISPTVSHVYFVRESPINLFKQYYQYGFWKSEIMKKHRRPISIRHLIPLLFCLYLFFLPIIINLFENENFILFIFSPIILYTIIIVLHVIIIFINSKNFLISMLSGLSAFIMHISYGFGTFLGIFSKYIFKSNFKKMVTELSR